MYKSYYPKADEIKENWVLVDASGQTLGRICAKVASLLLGKDKPTFTPGVPMGAHVVVINAANIAVTGKKLDDKFYNSHSGYPGGLKTVSLRDQLKNHPDRVIEAAVWGMIPHNKMGRAVLKRLKIYSGAEHPHSQVK